MNASIRSVTTRSAFAAAALLTACALTACGSTYSAAPKNAAATGAAATSAAPPAADAAPAESPKATDSAAPGDAGAAQDVGKTPTTLKKVKTKKMGDVVTDEKGWILYRFDNDTPKPSKSACNGDCAKVWPPVVSDDQEIVGLDAAKIGEVTRADGTKQVTLGGWPLYYYLGDTKPGDWTGQNVGKVWFAAAPDGKKNLTCVPKNPPKPPKPPADDASPAAEAGDGGYTY
ncbi:hypothetical protein [Cryptosporangium phraense]|uniref:Lipoprotein n=1 Tax=Cryptosporangium phraense TaxID=2593070 RepID=A0A545AVQ6_9ACTN|nr:hypothetical protein [Cryptosporangium phraense]TQS45419.1 hypothetical protein FL583_10075 [Cryptosporangium phraense]